MFNNKLIPIAMSIGATALVGLTAFPRSASAGTLSGLDCFSGTNIGGVIVDQGNDITDFGNRCGTITQLGKVQGRSGTNGPTLNGDYEIAIGPTGAQAGLTGNLQLDWNNSVTYDWELNFVPATNTVTFTLLHNGINPVSPSINFTYGGTIAILPFNAFRILVRADDPSSFISAGTTITLNVTSATLSDSTTATFSPLSVTATSASGGATRFVRNFYSVPTAGLEFTQLKGNFNVNFTGTNSQDAFGRSNGIGFDITLYDPPFPAQSSTEPVPEPSALLGLVGVLGLGWGLKRRKNV